jgi:site-specific DNA recombinase
LIREFEKAFRTEMQKLEGEDTEGGLKAAGRKLAQVRRAHGGIMKAIEAGADFADYSARDRELKAEEEALESQMNELKSRQAAMARPAPDIPAIFAQAIDELEALLSSPDTVAQASEYLSMLIGSVELTPDPEAEDGITVEVATDLAVLRTAASLLE